MGNRNKVVISDILYIKHCKEQPIKVGSYPEIEVFKNNVNIWFVVSRFDPTFKNVYEVKNNSTLC